MELVKMTTRIPRALMQQLQAEADSQDVFLQDLIAAKLSLGLADNESTILSLIAIREFMAKVHSLKAPAFDFTGECTNKLGLSEIPV